MVNNKPVFGVYEKALRLRSLEKLFDTAASCGYETFELSLDSTDQRMARLDWNAAERQAVRNAASNSGIKLLTTCLSGGKRYPLGSSNLELVHKGLEMTEKAIALCGDLGIRVIQLSGFDVYDQEPRTAETQKRYVENLFQCVQMAEKACVTLAIEPVEGNLLAVRDTMQVIRAINSCWLQLYPDGANINSLGIDPIRELPYGAGHIVAVHMRDSIIDCYDATIPFGTGCLDFEGVFRQLADMKFCGPLVVEMWNTEAPDDRERIIQARTYMEQCIEKVREQHVGSGKG